MNWQDSVTNAILRLTEQTGKADFTRQDLIDFGLEQIVKEVGAQGKTPHQTLGRVLQELREQGIVSFEANGIYRLVQFSKKQTVEPRDSNNGGKGNIKTKKISILPHRSLMPKIGQTGYSTSQAIAELVDNSIDARYEDKLLTVEIHVDLLGKFVEISDDGAGMNEETAANSIKLAQSSKKEKLGEFGLGLKSSATSLGKKFQIITKQLDSDEEYILEYDEKKWLEQGDWTSHDLKIQTGADKLRSGTKIRITDLSFKPNGHLPSSIRKDLSTRFAPYIETGEVQIKVNGKRCEPDALELKTEYHPPDGKEEFRFKLESGNDVWGWRGLLTKGSDKGDYGFRVFRRGRLILQHAKIGFNPHPEARQVIGELHLDHVPVTHNKREFIQESPLWQEIIKEEGIFWQFMRDLLKEARSSVRKTQIDQGILDKMEIRKDNIMRAIKKIPQLKEYAFPEQKEKARGTEEKHDGVDQLDIEKRDKQEIVNIEIEPEPTGDRTRKPKKLQQRKVYYIWVQGKRFRIQHSFADLKTDEVLKDKTVDDVAGIHVFTNIAFPAFATTKDHVFYGVWNIAECIAEVMVEKNKRPLEEVIKIRDMILKKSSEITRELDAVEQEKKVAEKLKAEYDEKLAKIKQMELNTGERPL